jgi:Flp pilus assembly protein TadD
MTPHMEPDAVQGDLLDQTHLLALRQWELVEPDAPARSAAPPEAPVAPPGDEVGALVLLGTELGAIGRYEDAERELRRAQRIAAEDPAVRAALGILYFRRGLYAQAEVDLAWVCARAPEHGPAHLYRGEVLNRLGRFEDAFTTLERAAVLLPDHPRPYYLMGILFDRKGMPDQAAAMFRRARELTPR